MRNEGPSLVEDLRVLAVLYFALLSAFIRRFARMGEPRDLARLKRRIAPDRSR
jgi:hypothetical protein